MRDIKSILDGYSAPKEKTRGDYLKDFAKETGYPIGFVGMKLKGLQDIKTLRYLDSVIRQEMARGKSFKHQFDIEILKIWK